MGFPNRVGSTISWRALWRAAAVAALACAALAAPAAARMAMPSSTVAVSVKLTAHPLVDSHSTTAKFAWTATGAGRIVTCRLGSTGYARCSSRHTYSSLTPGLHVFTVRVQAAGTTRTASYRWTVDTTPPTDPVVSGGSATTWIDVPVTIKASGSTDTGGSGFSGYQHRTALDGGAWSAAVSGGSAVVSTSGTTWVQFRALDKAGNASAWLPATGTDAATAEVDMLAPTVPTASGGSSSWSAAASAAVSATGSTDSGGSGLGTYQYRTSSDQGATWGAPTNGPSVTISAEGETQVEFRSTDVAGNSSAWSAPQLVMLDRTAPVVNLSGGSASWSNAASVTVTGSATDAGVGGVTLRYRTSTNNGVSWSAATTAPSVSISATGQTEVEFQAVDSLGNTSAWPGSAPAAGDVWLDRTAPTTPTSVSGGSLSWQKSAGVTLSASGSTDSGGSGLAGYQYRTSTDGGSTWSAPAGGAATVTADGTTLVQMRAVDTAGNVSASWAPASNGAGNTVNIDNTPPTLPTVSGGSAAWLNAASETIVASGSTDAESGFLRYEYRTSTDGGNTWSGVASGASAVVSAEAATEVEFRSVDVLGNSSAWTAVGSSAQANLDRTAPTTPVPSGGMSSWSGAASATVTASATDATSGVVSYAYRTSADAGGHWTSGSGSSVMVSAEGDTWVQFQATDRAGNVSAWSATAHVMLDRVAPTVPSVSGGSSTWTAGPVGISAGVSTDAGSGVAGYQYRSSVNNGSTWTSAAAGSGVTISAQGTTLVEFRALDNLGHASSWSVVSAASTAKIDTTPPADPTSVTGGNWQVRNLPSETVSASGSTDTGGSGLAGYQYRTSADLGSTWSAPQSGSSVTISAEGLTEVQFRAVDNAGNTSNWAPANQTMTSLVNLDRTPPSLPTVAYTTGSAGCSPGPKVLTASGSVDAGLGAVTYQYAVGGGAVKTGAAATITATGTTVVQFRAVDNVGNATAWVSTSVCIS